MNTTWLYFVLPCAGWYAHLFSRCARWLRRWLMRRQAGRTVRALASLDDRTLHDLGLGRSDIASVSAELHGLCPRTFVRTASAADARHTPTLAHDFATPEKARQASPPPQPQRKQEPVPVDLDAYRPRRLRAAAASAFVTVVLLGTVLAAFGSVAGGNGTSAVGHCSTVWQG